MTVRPGRNGDTVTFAQHRMKTVKPTLEVDQNSYILSKAELLDIFHISEARFPNLPREIVIPKLRSRYLDDGWHEIEGHLYIVEPKSWVPMINISASWPKSDFVTTVTITKRSFDATKFSAGCSAELSLSAGGSYFGTSANAKFTSSMEASFEKEMTTTIVQETVGKTGSKSIQEIQMFPTLSVISKKKQYLKYKFNNRSGDLVWDESFYNDRQAFWDKTVVPKQRLQDVEKFAWNRVPFEGTVDYDSVQLLPVPQLDGNGDLNITTLLKHDDWSDWHLYDQAWKDCDPDEVANLAVPKTAPFTPAMTWKGLEDHDASRALTTAVDLK